VSGPAGLAPLRATAGAPRAHLEELLHAVRAELRARDEDPSGAWIEETAAELAGGGKVGWYLDPPERGGLLFYARRGPALYAHLHAAGGLAPARRLVAELFERLPPDATSLDLGFTGLAVGDEHLLVAELARRPGSTVIARVALDRDLAASDAQLASEPPGRLERVPVDAVTLDALAELDRAAFEGSIDALLVGEEPGANRRALEAILAGRLGRFLDEASTALVALEPTRLVGAVLCAERSSRRAVIVALMVEPASRRRGLGRFLLGWGLRALWALGYESARLWVSLENVPARELYRRFGFREVLPATIYRWGRPASVAQRQDAA